MRATRLTLQHFTKHSASVVELPERGLVLVTGANGSGKSSLYDALAWAVWGETVRGRSPLPSKAGTTMVEVVEGDGLHVVRSTRSGKTSLTWSPRKGEAGVSYGTVTKAAEALHAITGSFERWRRTHVFTLRDPWSFTTASDRDRKVFLERLLGLEVFDGALEACRGDLRAASSRRAAQEVFVQREMERLLGAGARVTDAHRVLDATGPAVDTKAAASTLARLKGMMAEAANDVLAAEQEHRQAELGLVAEATRRRVEVEGLRKRLSVFTASGTCTACGSALPPERRAELESALAVAEVPVADPAVVLRDEVERCDSAREELRLLREKVAAAERELTAAQAVARQREVAIKNLRAAEEAHAEAMGRVEGGRSELARMSREVATLEAVERVLGLRGVRAAVLGEALSGIEAVANTWLARLGMPELLLHLATTSTRASGAVVDAISVEVEGAADGQGYQGASGGERTRFDLALMLALADVAGGLVAGGGGGTLWFDEVLDTLDASGVEAVVGLLEELSADRPVVVISHAVDLIERLHPSAVLRLRVEDGGVRAG